MDETSASVNPIVAPLSALILRSKPSPKGRRLASRRMAACTAARVHPSRRIAGAMLLRMRSESSHAISFREIAQLVGVAWADRFDHGRRI